MTLHNAKRLLGFVRQHTAPAAIVGSDAAGYSVAITVEWTRRLADGRFELGSDIELASSLREARSILGY